MNDLLLIVVVGSLVSTIFSFIQRLIELYSINQGGGDLQKISCALKRCELIKNEVDNNFEERTVEQSSSEKLELHCFSEIKDEQLDYLLKVYSIIKVVQEDVIKEGTVSYRKGLIVNFIIFVLGMVFSFYMEDIKSLYS